MNPNVLLLQGPIGPFFSRFSDELSSRGFNVWKVNLNAGDRHFYSQPQAVDYTGTLQDWDTYLERLIINKDIGRMYLFGDCRAYHREARKIAKRRGIRLFVFEEGYIRPNYITLEEHGVNGHSPMLQQTLDLTDLPAVSEEEMLADENSLPTKTFFRSASYAMTYYIKCRLQRKHFPNYQHHRTLRVFSEGARWIRSGFRKWWFQRTEKNVLKNVVKEYEDNYFVCPLQVHCDMQVVVHSKFNSIEHFIGDVLNSFARHAAPNKAIVFKHHPMDRAYKDYSILFENLIGELGLQGRVFYVHDVCLPTLLKHAEGTVLINSTVGMSSLFHGTPVKTLGKAIYNLPGLTAQRSLESFWGRPGVVNRSLFASFRQYLVENNQLNGSFVAQLTENSATGVTWSAELAEEHRYIEDRVDPVAHPALRVVGGLDVDGGVGVEVEDKKAA